MPFQGLMGYGSDQTSGPKAYLNVLVFDQNYTLLSSTYEPVTGAAEEDGSNVAHEHLTITPITIEKPGYVYIYTSNENPTPVDVFFDDFKVTHTNTPIVQKDDYYPFGGTFNSYTSGTENLYKYNGKEEQKETGLYDYGARMLDPWLARWQVIDPDGREIRYAKGVSDEFKAQFAEAVQYLNEHGAGGILADLQSSETVYYIGEAEGGSSYNTKTRTISWDPNTAVLTDNLVELSPSSVLNHEADHALQHDQNPEQQKKDGSTPDKDYGNKEEKRVITGSEQETAKKLGEIKEGEVTRTNHNGSLYPTTGPTSTDTAIIIEGNKDEEDEK